jgi:hypothetical protein
MFEARFLDIYFAALYNGAREYGVGLPECLTRRRITGASTAESFRGASSNQRNHEDETNDTSHTDDPRTEFFSSDSFSSSLTI